MMPSRSISPSECETHDLTLPESVGLVSAELVTLCAVASMGAALWLMVTGTDETGVSVVPLLGGALQLAGVFEQLRARWWPWARHDAMAD